MKGQGDMAGQTQRAGWRCIEVAAEMLTPLEREVVLGDLAETNRSVWCGLADVSGFRWRLQRALWRRCRAWAARFTGWGGMGRLSGGSVHARTTHVEQGWMDVWLLAVLAGAVSDGNVAAAFDVTRKKTERGGKTMNFMGRRIRVYKSRRVVGAALTMALGSAMLVAPKSLI